MFERLFLLSITPYFSVDIIVLFSLTTFFSNVFLIISQMYGCLWPQNLQGFSIYDSALSCVISSLLDDAITELSSVSISNKLSNWIRAGRAGLLFIDFILA